MNERITKLAYTAKEYATTRHPVSKIVLNVDPYVFEQKFAESLVRECMSVCIDDIADPRDTTELKCAKKIKEHFGVKE